MNAIEVNHLTRKFKDFKAVDDISFTIPQGEIFGPLGPNGAGKTTLLNSISRMVSTAGSITWNDKDLTSLNPTKISKMGIMHVPSGRHVFPGLTVMENLELGTANWRGAFGKADYKNDVETIFALFPRLKERKEQLAWSMSGGEQQMLAIGRAMMGRPKILLLDEPSMGLAPVVVAELFEKIVEINQSGITILLVEQNARIALENTDYAYVIEEGHITLEGPSEQLRDDPKVVQAYLGKFVNQ